MKHDGQTKTVILKEALTLFAEKGYFGTSMSDLARAVGIKKASLYSHFNSKESIFREIFDSILVNHQVALKSILSGAGGSCRNKLEHIFRSYVFYCKDNKEIDFWIRFYYFSPPELLDEIYRKTRDMEDVIEGEYLRLFREGIELGEFHNRSAEDMAISFYFLQTGVVLSLTDYKDKSPAQDIDRTLTVFMNGVCK